MMTRWMMRLLLRPVYRALRPPITLVALLLLLPIVGLNSCAPETRSMLLPTVAPFAALGPARGDPAGPVTRIADGDSFRTSLHSARIRVRGLGAAGACLNRMGSTMAPCG